MHANRLRSCEVPVVMAPRITGQSAITLTQSATTRSRYCWRIRGIVSRAIELTGAGHLSGRRGARGVSLAVNHLASPFGQRAEVIALALVICLVIFELVRRST